MQAIWRTSISYFLKTHPTATSDLIASTIVDFRNPDYYDRVYKSLAEQQPHLHALLGNFILAHARDSDEQSLVLGSVLITFDVLRRQANADGMNRDFYRP